MKTLRRHLFTSVILALFIAIVFGWWHSSRQWSAWELETPAGIFTLHSEASFLGGECQWVRHERRWDVFANGDPAMGDAMRFPWVKPIFQIQGNYQVFLVPFWQIALALLILAGAVFALERRRIRKALNPS